MDMTYGIKTGNKFCIADLVDDDEILDPCEILRRLETSAKEAKTLASTASKKKALLTQPKKTISVVNNSEKLTKPTMGKDTDISRPPRIATNKENFVAVDTNKEAGPRPFPRGGAALNARGVPRNRLPRQERNPVPPRFRQSNEGNQDFQQNGFEFQSTNDGGSFQRDPQMDIQQNGGFNNTEKNSYENRSLNRTRGFGGRGGRSGGSTGGFDAQARGARRPYDRQSGSDKTGVKAVEKRDGAGAHNWGSAAAVIADDVGRVEQPPSSGGTEQTTHPAVDSEKTTGGDEGGKVAENAQTEVSEPEPVQLTLDEWKAQQGPRQQPQFKVRRPGEGDKNPAWEKLKPLKGGDEPKKTKNKSKPRDVIPVDEDEDDEDDNNKVVPINIRFIGEPSRGRGGRGRGVGRGFGVGSRDTGLDSPRKEKAMHKNETPYKIDDESFPSLS